MDDRPLRYSDANTQPTLPNVFFDGTRLGLEAAMITALSIGVLSGIQVSLSSAMGYFVRYADGLPAAAHPVTLGGFVGIWLIAFLAVTMILFFGGAIPVMAYTMGLVSLMLYRLRKRRGRERLVGAIGGGLLGCLCGLPCWWLILMITDMIPNWSFYAAILRWPAIMSVDGVIGIWGVMLPLLNIIGGVRSGYKIGKMIQDVQMLWMF